MTEARLDVVIGSQGAVSGGNAVNRIVNEVKNNFIDLAAKTFVVQQALTRVWASAREGAEFQETMGRLNQQMGRLGSSAIVMVSAMQRVTNGQLDMANASRLASRALAVGLSPEQIGVFAQAAEELSDIMGTDIPVAFDRLIQATANGSSRALQEVGVFIDLDDEMRKLALSTGRTTEQITKQERAMLTAKTLVAALKDETSGLGESSLSTADKFAVAARQWQDFADALKADAASLTVLFTDMVAPLLEAFEFVSQGGRGLLPHQQPPGAAGAGGLPTGSLASGGGAQGLPFSLASARVESRLARDLLTSRQATERDNSSVGALSQVIDAEAQRRLITEERAVQQKLELGRVEFTNREQLLRRELALEERKHKEILSLESLTTEGKEAEQNKYTERVVEINEGLKQIARDRWNFEQVGEAQLSTARFQARERERENALQISQAIFTMGERRRQQELSSQEELVSGLIALDEARFASDAQIASRERDLLRAQLAFKLKLKQDEVAALLQAGRANDTGTVNRILDGADPLLTRGQRLGITGQGVGQDIRLLEREQNNFFAGWRRGLQQYARDTNTGFGLAQDMARRTAQLMEQNFQQFFFDPFERGWQGVLDNMANMTRQIFSQIAAQLVTTGIINLITGSVSGGGGAGSIFSSLALSASRNVSGVNVRTGDGFARGGVDDFGQGTVTTLHGPEAIVPLPDGRSIPVTLNNGGMGSGVTMPVTIINQHNGAEVSAEQTTGSNGMPQLEILVTKAVNRSISEGRMDKSLRSRFGLSPGER